MKSAIRPMTSSASDGSHWARPADVLHPLAGLHPDDVEPESDHQQRERRARGVGRALLERGKARAEDVEREDDGRKRERREVRDVRSPVEPAGEKPLALAERLRRPDVEAAFFRDRRGERGHRKALRDEEDDGGEDPEEERRRSVGRRERDPAHADDRGDVEEDDVLRLELALQRHASVPYPCVTGPARLRRAARCRRCRSPGPRSRSSRHGIRRSCTARRRCSAGRAAPFPRRGRRRGCHRCPGGPRGCRGSCARRAVPAVLMPRNGSERVFVSGE